MADDGGIIVLRLGAALDSTIEKSFAAVEARANKAAKALQQSTEQATKASENAAKRRGTADEQAAKRQETAAARAAARQQRETERASKSAQRETEKAAAAQIRATEKVARAREQAAKRAADAEQRSNRSLGQRFARSTADTASRFIAPYAPLASLARRTAGDLVRGAGIDLDPGAILGRAIDLNARATTLSANAYQPGAAGAAGIRQNPSELVGESRGIAKKYGLDAGDVLGGLEKFTAVAGDLETGRKTLEDMAKLAIVTGSGMENVVDAAGQVAAILPEGEGKAQRVADVMKAMAGQGRLGAVELKDMAVQMAKVASAAGRIEGDPAENIKRLGALMQLARQRGGATGGAQAATSIARLADTLVTPARAKGFEAAGIHVTDKKTGMIRDPAEVIFETIAKFGKDPIKLKSLFASSIGAKPAEGLANILRQGGDPKAEFEKLLHASLGEKQVNEDLAAAMDTPKAKLAKFQAALDETGDKLMLKLLPAFEQLAPKLLELSDVLTRTVTWIADNPKEAIATGIALSIGRAGIESTLRAGIERILTGAGGQNAGALGGVAGNIGAAFTVATLAVATLTVGKAIIDLWATKDEQNQRQGALGLAEANVAGNTAERKFAAGDVEGAKKSAEEAGAKAESGLAGVGNPSDTARNTNIMRGALLALTGPFELFFDKALTDSAKTRIAAETETRNQLLEELRRSNRIQEQIAQNTAAGPPPGAPPAPGPPGTTTGL
jgi:hypothetical protein